MALISSGKPTAPATLGSSSAEPHQGPLTSATTVDYWSGALGSAMMTFASIGIGWLAPISELRRLPLFIGMRTEFWGVVISVALLTAGGMLLTRAWLRLGQEIGSRGQQAAPAVVRAMSFWSLPLLFSVPLFSRDVYAYIGQGRLMLEGLNPYQYGISALPNYFQLGADKMWTEAPVPYGQVFLWIEQAIVGLTGLHPEMSVVLFRLVSIAGVVISAYYIQRLARHFGVDPAKALWISAANPVFLTCFVASVHNDSLMIGLALAGLYYALTGRAKRGVLLVTLAVSIKPIALIFLPFIGLLWAGRNPTWGRKIRSWTAVGLMSFSLLTLLGLLAGTGFGWIDGIFDRGSMWIWYAPVGLAGLIVASIGNSFGVDGWNWATWVHLVGKVASIIVVGWQILRGDNTDVVRRLAIAFAALVLLAPMIQSWWILWFLPLFAVIGIPRQWHFKAIPALTIFFMIYAISDQIEVFPYLQPGDLTWPLSFARGLAAVLSIAAGIYLIFFDPKTKALFTAAHTPAPITKGNVPPSSSVPAPILGSSRHPSPKPES
ncbi:polyprenol phosphomannose-dependent alpha 1,6 mannosyltransferase MptB [Paenarthrobacter sp. NPDC056912]|uniref:polyprenol phosphomannose-dependent alpha 1,6 mannosyltransferase MptB n=1 Tax=Paenarthrobacter sp. NPDC056912 TaxID=3345965 RepID=UPI00366D1CCA